MHAILWFLNIAISTHLAGVESKTTFTWEHPEDEISIVLLMLKMTAGRMDLQLIMEYEQQ
jgi:hypothetical protein